MGEGVDRAGRGYVCCCVPIQGLHPSKDLIFAVFEGESFGETLKNFCHDFCHPGPRKRQSVSCDVAIFFLSSYFSGMRRILGHMRPRRDSSGASSKNREKKEHLWAAFGGTFESGQSLRDPELRRSNSVCVCMWQCWNWKMTSLLKVPFTCLCLCSHHIRLKGQNEEVI